MSDLSEQLCHISITWPEHITPVGDQFGAFGGVLIERKTSDWLVSRERSMEIWRMLVEDFVDAARQAKADKASALLVEGDTNE